MDTLSLPSVCLYVLMDPRPFAPTTPINPLGICVMSCQVGGKPVQAGFRRPLVFTSCETLLTRVFV